jgi:hypothetical protein
LKRRLSELGLSRRGQNVDKEATVWLIHREIEGASRLAARRSVTKEFSPGRLAQQVTSAQSIRHTIFARLKCLILYANFSMFLQRFIHNLCIKEQIYPL